TRLVSDWSSDVCSSDLLLVESDSVLGNIKRPAAQPVLYVNKHIGQIAVAHFNGLCLIRALAGRVLAHVDLGRFRCGSIEFDSAEIGRASCRGRGWMEVV